jgi:hypothetical protein
MINLQSVTEIPSSLKAICFAKTQMFLSRVQDFNTRWSVNIEVQKSAKWAIGTYDKIKDAATRRMFPQWFTKHGANKAYKLKRYQPWNFENLTQSFEKLDHSLRALRLSKTIFHGELAENEGIEWINNFNSAVAKYNQYEGIMINVTDLPYFSRSLRNGHRSAKNILPVFDKDMNMIKSLGELHYGSDYFEELKGHRNYESPDSWNVNIFFQLKDIMIDYIDIRDVNDHKVLHQFPYGDLVVGFSLSLEVLFKMSNLDANRNTFNHVLGNDAIGQHTYQFPKRAAMRHPYVKSHRSENQSLGPHRDDFLTYDMGNTCFGDFKFDILAAIGRLQFGVAKSLIHTWSSSFPYRNQNPLAGTSYWVFGKQPEVENLPRLAISQTLCDRELQIIDLKERAIFKEEYCTNCLVERCEIKFNYFSTVLAEELSTELVIELGDYQTHFRQCMSSKFRSNYQTSDFMRDFGVGFCRGADYLSSEMNNFYDKINSNSDMESFVDWYFKAQEIAARWYYLDMLSDYGDAYNEHTIQWDRGRNTSYRRKPSAKLFRQLKALRLVRTNLNPTSTYNEIIPYDHQLRTSQGIEVTTLSPMEEVSF